MGGLRISERRKIEERRRREWGEIIMWKKSIRGRGNWWMEKKWKGKERRGGRRWEVGEVSLGKLINGQGKSGGGGVVGIVRGGKWGNVGENIR